MPEQLPYYKSRFALNMVWMNIAYCDFTHKYLVRFGTTENSWGHTIKQHFQFVLTLVMRWFVQCEPLVKTSEMRDQWNIKLFIGSSFFSNFRTIAAHTTIRPFNGEIRQRTSNLKAWMNYLFIYSQSKYFFSNFRSTPAHSTNISFNGEIKQRTSTTWRL